VTSVAEPDLTAVFKSYFPVNSEIIVNEMEYPYFVGKSNGYIIAIRIYAKTQQRIGIGGFQIPNLKLLNHLTSHLLVVPNPNGGILSRRSYDDWSVLTDIHLGNWS